VPSNPRSPFRMPSDSDPQAHLGGKRVAVNLVVNVEHWPFDRPMPRGLMTPPHGKGGEPPDVANFSWVEYGLRRGMPRLLAVLRDRGLRASATMNSSVVEVYPALAERIGESGWDIIAHGVIQQSLKAVDDERAVIEHSVAQLERYYGRRIRGWLGPGIAQTAHTAEHLKAVGLEYTHDWMIDDQPSWLRTAHGPLLALPYTLELNDVPIWAIQAHPSDTLLRRAQDSCAVLSREADRLTQVLTIALHPHLVAVPHRLPYFELLLDTLLDRDDVIFATSDQLADWFVAICPAETASIGAGGY
jgi:allantoinase